MKIDMTSIWIIRAKIMTSVAMRPRLIFVSDVVSTLRAYCRVRTVKSAVLSMTLIVSSIMIQICSSPIIALKAAGMFRSKGYQSSASETGMNMMV